MATTWAVKMEEEEKEKLQALIEESGLNSKEFISQLMDTYALNRTKEAVPVLSADIDELQKLTNRINAVFMHVGERIDTLMTDKDQEYRSALEAKEALIGTLQEKIDSVQQLLKDTDQSNRELQDENQELNRRVVNLEDEYNKRVNQFNEVNQSNHDLIEQYKEKIETLTGIVNEYKQAAEENKALSKGLQEAQGIIDVLSREKVDRDKEIENLKQRHQEQIEKHQEAIQHAEDKLLFEKEKALLEQEKKFNAGLQEMQEKYNEKVQDLLSKMENVKQPKTQEAKNKQTDPK